MSTVKRAIITTSTLTAYTAVMRCCLPSSTFGFERIFNRIRYVLACCGGKVIVQNSKFCAGENTGQHLSRPKSSRKFRWFGCCIPSSQRKEETKGKSKISRKQVQDWLSQQDVYTLHESARRRYKRSRAIAPGIDVQFQADLCDLQNLIRYNKGYKYLLTCVDIFSKHAWVVALKTKQGQELEKAFQTILSSGRKPSKLQTDQGYRIPESCVSEIPERQ